MGTSPAFKRSQFGLVVVHQDHLVAQVGETRPRHQSHITRTHHCNVHPNAPSEYSTKTNSARNHEEKL